MTEKGSEKVKKRTGKLLSSFVVLTIVLSVLAASVTSVSAPPPPPKPTEIVVTANPSSIPAEVGSTSTITATVINWTGAGPGGLTVYFVIEGPDYGTSISPELPIGNTTDDAGNAYAILTAGAGVEPGTVTVKVTGEGGIAVNTTTVTLISEYGVELTVDQAERTTAPDVDATYTLTVRNTGTPTDSYILEFENPDADFAVLNRTTIADLVAGATADVSLTVRDATPGDYVVNVTVTSQTESTATDSESTTTHVVEPEYSVNLTVTPEVRTVAPSENATYTLTVKNTGNTEDTFDIVIDDVPADATATLSEGVTPELAPDGTYDIFLNVSSAIENEMGYIVNVTAASQGDPSKSDTVTTKTIVWEEITIEYNLIKKPDSTGKNWISIPIGTTITNASSLMAAIGPNCDAVNRWNAITQQPEGWISLGGGMGTNFNIVAGEGYEISVTANTTFNLTGVPVSIGPIDLIKKPDSTGKNWIGLPDGTTITNASSLMAAIGSNCDAVNRWNGTTQQPEGWISLGGGMGTNFNIVAGEGYEISVTANTTWTPI